MRASTGSSTWVRAIPRLHNAWIESGPAEEDFRMFGGWKPQCVLLVSTHSPETNHILGGIKSSMASKSREIILPINSPLLRPHLQNSVQLWGPKLKDLHKWAMDLLIQGGPQIWSGGWSTSPVRTGWESWGYLMSGEKRKLWGNLTAAFQYQKVA